MKTTPADRARWRAEYYGAVNAKPHTPLALVDDVEELLGVIAEDHRTRALLCLHLL